jgi:hypothetical protein
MRRFLLLVLAVSLSLSASAQKKKEPKRELPDQVLVARFVYVTGWHGGLYDSRTPPEERSAIMRVQKALDDWPRYRLAYCPEQADIMLVVKPGKLGMVQGGVRVGPGGPEYPPPPSKPCFGYSEAIDRATTGGREMDIMNGQDLGYGAEAGSPDDFLMLTLRPSYRPMNAAYIWKKSARNGFTGKLTLVEDFKETVNQSDSARAASRKP